MKPYYVFTTTDEETGHVIECNVCEASAYASYSSPKPPPREYLGGMRSSLVWRCVLIVWNVETPIFEARGLNE